MTDADETTTTCDREVSRDGQAEPCGNKATGVAYDDEGGIYPACNAHRQSSAALLAAYLAERAY